MHVINTTWYGWVPTNRGKLKFDYISLHKEILKINKNVLEERTPNIIEYSNLNISYLSDSYSYRFFRRFKNQKETPGMASILFTNNKENIDGKVTIAYSNFGSLCTSFVCNKNGIIKFENIYHEFENLNIYLNEIKSLLYVLIKTIIHGDAHHHQKIDIALPITHDKFKPVEISSALLDYIKLVERNVKKSNHCESLLRNGNLVFEIDGYLSYFKSFTLLFKDQKVMKDFEFAQNVVESLRSTVSKRRHKEEFKNSIQTAAITFIGLFISINILISGFWEGKESNITQYLQQFERFDLVLFSLGILICMFYFYSECKLKSSLYKYNYTSFDILRLIKNSNYTNLNNYGKIIKFIPNVFFLLLFIIYFEDIFFAILSSLLE